VTVTVAELELEHPTKVAPCFWEERHCPQKIPDRRVAGVQAQLNKPALESEKRHRFVEGRYQTRQNHDLATGQAAQLRRDEAWEWSWRSLFSGRLNEPSTESQSIPRNVKLVVGMMLDFSQLMRNSASIRIERAR
jgi:hypothetical protein